jgi:N-acylglucosamine 2-epimerase
MIPTEHIPSLFKEELTTSILPFWLKHGLDPIHGGILTGLGRDGTLLESDKSIWFQGRAAWTFATAYRVAEKNEDYLLAAKSCLDFLKSHAQDTDGRFFFRVSRSGEPIIKRSRYIFSELFAALGSAAYSRAVGEEPVWAEAIFAQALKTLEGDLLEPKFLRKSEGFALPMIIIVVAQELRAANPKRSDYYDSLIATLIEKIERLFINEENQCVLEQTGIDGVPQFDHFEGRMLNPGHAIEGAWFIMKEAKIQNNSSYFDLGKKMLDWMWEWGWDKEDGGIIYFKDALGHPPYEYWHDMKFWWPQTEAVIATLFAYQQSGDEHYLTHFNQIYEWTLKHFKDEEHGEWYGYLHKNGSLSVDLKGNMFKGPFHIPRMFLEGIELFS